MSNCESLLKYLEDESLRVISSKSIEKGEFELVSVRIHLMDLYNWGGDLTLAKLNETFPDLISIEIINTNLGQFVFYSGNRREDAIKLLQCFIEILKCN